MVAYVNIIRSINALPLDHTKARTLWLKCESGEEIKIKINGCLPFFSFLETPIYWTAVPLLS